MKIMSNLKKIISLAIAISMCHLFSGQTDVLAQNEMLQLGAYNMNGERTCIVNVTLSEFMIKDETGENWIGRSEISQNFEVTEKILSVAEENENFIYMDFKTDHPENPYPAIEPASVSVSLPSATGNVRHILGKDYHLYYAPDADGELKDISDQITDTSLSTPSFAIDKLGVYILYFNPKAYSVTFYSEEPIYDEEGNWTNKDCIYAQIEDLEYNDIINFPEIPQKNGYIFTGWKAQHYVGGSSSIPIQYTTAQPIKVSTHRAFFATWCLESKYEPINITIFSDQTITKGKENGKKITLKTNYGVFVKDDEFPAEWQTAYEAETDEQIKAAILLDWKSKWNVIGSDDIIIESAERIDDKTIAFILSGNSNDEYSNGEIYIEFDSSLLMPESYENSEKIADQNDTKIKMDADGIREKMYRSDNAINLSPQYKSSSGSSSPTTYTVKFDTNGGSIIANKTAKRNTPITAPEAPAKEGFTFKGWFTDTSLKTAYDFNAKVTKNMTLYAAWEKIDITNNQIILIIGEKNAQVFGETKINDVAPKIINNRAMLPSRFIAESLGAAVAWNEEKQEVKITGKNMENENINILIYIDSDIAYVNGKEIKLDSPAFIENDRTYTPLRFISENLGADVDWNVENQMITITAKRPINVQ